MNQLPLSEESLGTKKRDQRLCRLIVALLLMVYFGLCFLSEPVSFGQDADAFRVADAALSISGGVYIPSRLPGYPVHEWLVSLVVVPADSRPAKMLSALGAVLALLGFIWLAMGQKDPAGLPAWSLVLAFGLWPVLAGSTFTVMDYTIGLGFWLLGCGLWMSWESVPGRNWLLVLAGVCSGLSVATRLSYSLFPLAVCIVLLVRSIREPGQRRLVLNSIILFGSGHLSALPFFVPLIRQYGFDFLRYYPVSSWDLGDFLYNLSVVWVRLFSHVTVLLVVCACGFRELFSGRVRCWAEGSLLRQAMLVFGALIVLFHFNKPYEVEYLLPVVPVILLYLLNRPGGYSLRRKWFSAALALALLSGNFIAPDGRFFRDALTDAGRQPCLDGLPAREFRNQALDSKVFPAVDSLSDPLLFKTYFLTRLGHDPTAYDAVLLMGYSFYVRRHLWLADVPQFYVNDLIKVGDGAEPHVFIVLPHASFVRQFLDIMPPWPDTNPRRVLVVTRSHDGPGVFSPLFHEACRNRPDVRIDFVTLLPPKK